MGCEAWKKVLAVFLGAVIAYWFIDDFDPESLKGKRVLVTGASTGIGEQLAYHYTRFGANVVVTARRQHALQKVVQRCSELGSADGVYGYVAADMGDLNSVNTVIQEAVRQMGGVDILVLNHIMPHFLAPWSGSPDNLTLLHRLLDVNFRSYVHLTSEAMPWLQKSSGSIIVMSSVAGKVGVPYVAAYSATKFALYGFYSALRNEFVLEGDPAVSITLCTIGLVGTENALHYLETFGNKAIFDIIKPADPADVALAVVKGGALRHREVFYPYLATKFFSLLRDWCPELINSLVRYYNTPSRDS